MFFICTSFHFFFLLRESRTHSLTAHSHSFVQKHLCAYMFFVPPPPLLWPPTASPVFFIYVVHANRLGNSSSDSLLKCVVNIAVFFFSRCMYTYCLENNVKSTIKNPKERGAHSYGRKCCRITYLPRVWLDGVFICLQRCASGTKIELQRHTFHMYGNVDRVSPWTKSKRCWTHGSSDKKPTGSHQIRIWSIFPFALPSPTFMHDFLAMDIRALEHRTKGYRKRLKGNSRETRGRQGEKKTIFVMCIFHHMPLHMCNAIQWNVYAHHFSVSARFGISEFHFNSSLMEQLITIKFSRPHLILRRYIFLPLPGILRW